MHRFLVFVGLGFACGVVPAFAFLLYDAKQKDEAPFGKWSGKREGSQVFMHTPGTQSTIWTCAGIGAASGAVLWWFVPRKQNSWLKS